MQMQISMIQISHYRDANTISLRCKFSYRDVNAKSIHDDANTPLRRCRCKSLFFDIKNAPCGYAMMQKLFFLTQMQFNQNFFLFFESRLFRSLEPKCFQNSIYFFKNHSFLFRRGLNAQCTIPTPKTCSILT